MSQEGDRPAVKKLDLSKFTNVSHGSSSGSTPTSPTSPAGQKLDLSKFGNIKDQSSPASPLAKMQKKPTTESQNTQGDVSTPVSESPEVSDVRKRLETMFIPGIMNGPPPGLFKKSPIVPATAAAPTESTPDPTASLLPSLTTSRAKKPRRAAAAAKPTSSDGKDQVEKMQAESPATLKETKQSALKKDYINPDSICARQILETIKTVPQTLSSEHTRVSETKDAILLMAKGKKTPRVVKMKPGVKSLTRKDSFVLYGNTDIYIYHGEHSSIFAKSKAAEVAHIFKDEVTAGRGTITEIPIDRMGSGPCRKFWDLIVGKFSDVSDDSYIDEQAFESVYLKSLALYTAKGSRVNAIDTPPTKIMLETEHTFILQCLHEIYLWYGNRSPEDERAAAYALAQQILSSFMMQPLHETLISPVLTTVYEHAEPPSFKCKFTNWSSKTTRNVSLAVKPQANIIRKDKTPYVTGADVLGKKFICAKGMLEQIQESRPNALAKTMDHGTGEIKVWRCDSTSRIEVPKYQIGIFNDLYSYVVLYKHESKDGIYKIYCWQGARCPATERGVATLLSVELNRAYMCTIAEETQYQESLHFLSIFKHQGRFVVLHDHLYNGLKHIADNAHAKEPLINNMLPYQLNFFVNEEFQPVGFTTDLSADSEICLTSNCASMFIPTTERPGAVIWMGGNPGLGTHREKIKDIALNLLAFHFPNGNADEVTLYLRIVNESKTDPQSKDAISELQSEVDWLKTYKIAKAPAEYLRLLRHRMVNVFEVNFSSGEPRAHLQPRFCIHDFNPSKIFIIDAYYALYVWAGPSSQQDTLKMALRAAKEFSDEALIYADNDRAKNFYIESLVFSGDEPSEFYGLFYGYVPSLLRSITDALPVAASIGEFGHVGTKPTFRNMRKTKATSIRTSLRELSSAALYNLETLLVPTADLPPAVDASKKEQYLCDEDFEKVFGMDRARYFALPHWRQIELKKKTPLF